MPPSIAERLRTVPLQWFVVAGAAAVLAVSAAFGGMARAQDSGPQTVAAGVAIDGQPWDVTIVDTRILSSQPGLEAQKKGDRWLVIVATVDITSSSSRSDMKNAVRLRGVTGLLAAEPDEILLAQDGSNVAYLNPGMPQRVGFAWEQSAAAPIPTSVQVEVYDETRQPDLGDNLGWFRNDTPQAIVRTTVQDKRT